MSELDEFLRDLAEWVRGELTDDPAPWKNYAEFKSAFKDHILKHERLHTACPFCSHEECHEMP